MGPALLLEADRALSYGEELVRRWLAVRMLRNEAQREARAEEIASYFNAAESRFGQIHAHGQRIGPEKLRELGLTVQMIEDDQELQDDILTAYHLATMIFENSNLSKILATDAGRWWSKPDTA